MNKVAPKVLIETWIALSKDSRNPQAQQIAIDKLFKYFGDAETMMIYMTKHGLK